MSVSAVFPSDAPQMVRPLGNAEQYYGPSKVTSQHLVEFAFIFVFFLILIVTKKLAK